MLARTGKIPGPVHKSNFSIKAAIAFNNARSISAFNLIADDDDSMLPHCHPDLLEYLADDFVDIGLIPASVTFSYNVQLAWTSL